MKLTDKLLSFLHRIFDKDPAPFLALRLRYNGDGMTWSISDAMLTTSPVGGIGGGLVVDLSRFRLGELVNYLAAQPGYIVEYADRSELSLLGAQVLMDGAGDQKKSNGDHLYGYTNVLWSYMEANARELQEASDQVEQMLLQMSTKTAGDVWLDELGGYYGVPRLSSEPDASYSLRIIAEVLRPRGNNVAIEAAITAYTGQETSVTDVVVNSPLLPMHNGAIDHDGSELYDSRSSPLYGLFDVEYGYDIIGGGDISSFAQIIRDLVNRLRDAGTHLRALSLKGSDIFDTLAAPSDAAPSNLTAKFVLQDAATAPADAVSGRLALATISDSLTAPSDELVLTINSLASYNGARVHDGTITYSNTSDDNPAAPAGTRIFSEAVTSNGAKIFSVQVGT